MERILSLSDTYTREQMGELVAVRARPVEINDTFRFHCQKDGLCCSSTPALSPFELSEFASYLGMSKKAFFGQYCEVKSPHIVLAKDGQYCTFLERNGGAASCSVYEVRPYRCRARPIFKPSTSSGIYVSYCHGMDALGAQEFNVGEWIETNRIGEGWKEREAYLRRFGVLEGELLEAIARKKSTGKRKKMERSLSRRKLDIVMHLFGI